MGGITILYDRKKQYISTRKQFYRSHFITQTIFFFFLLSSINHVSIKIPCTDLSRLLFFLHIPLFAILRTYVRISDLSYVVPHLVALPCHSISVPVKQKLGDSTSGVELHEQYTDGNKMLHTLLAKYYINCLEVRGMRGAGAGQPTC